jgi:hypothetical protein
MTRHIIDIDFTIADSSYRASLLSKHCNICFSPVSSFHRSACPNCSSTDVTVDQSAWDNFLSPELVSADLPIPEAQRVIKYFVDNDIDHLYLTGRNESLRYVTEKWLMLHYGYNPARSRLLMRPFPGKEESASACKEKLFKSIYDRTESYIFYEDDPHVFSLYQEYGLVLRCPEAWQYLYPKGIARHNEPIRNV